MLIIRVPSPIFGRDFNVELVGTDAVDAYQICRDRWDFCTI
jgi:hypothetical protein